MTETDPAQRAVALAITELNDLLPPDHQIEFVVGTRLASSLDSLGVVNLLLGVERCVEESAGISISLMDLLERDPESSPLATVGDFVTLVRERMQGATT
jgi:acyl carrier protein